MRLALYHQVRRTELRQRGLNDILRLLKSSSGLMASARYYLMCGWQGIRQNSPPSGHPRKHSCSSPPTHGSQGTHALILVHIRQLSDLPTRKQTSDGVVISRKNISSTYVYEFAVWATASQKTDTCTYYLETATITILYFSAPGSTEGIELAPPYLRVQVILARAGLLEWAAGEFRRLVRAAEDQIRDKIPKGAKMKESLNHRDLHGVGTLSYSRYVHTL